MLQMTNIRLGLIALIVVTWLMLLFVQIFFNIKTTIFCQICEFIFDTLNVALAYQICINIRLNTKYTIYLVISMVSLLLVDVWYFLVYSAPHLSEYDLVFDTIHLFWYLMIIPFLLLILLEYILNLRQICIILFIAIIDVIIFKVFSINTYYIWTLTIRNIIFLIQFCFEVLAFNLAVLWLIYSKNVGVSLIASGYIILMATGFMFSSSYLSKIFLFLPYAELFWVLGVIFITCGMICIIKNKHYTIQDWFGTNAAIRSKLTFWSFSIAFVSIIILFAIIWQFAVINHIFFIFFPTIIIIYSLIVIYLSIFIFNQRRAGLF